MKVMIVSDIHGSIYYAEKMMKCFEEEKAEQIICLGDILYHGPRNELPNGYNPKKVIELLKNYQDKIIAVRGNCDAEVDLMVLDFLVINDYSVFYFDGVSSFISHGHINNESKMLNNYKILLNGHTHIPGFKKHDSYLYLNPGSISIPKNNSKHSYLIYENKEFVWKDLEGKAFLNLSI